MGKFEFSRKQEGNRIVVDFNGSIDEDVSFSGIEISGANEISLDLGGITAINSCGIREWIKWIGQGEGATKIVVRNCPKVIVDQINMVSGFLPANALVESFYVPYFGEDSDIEKMVLFERGKDFSDGKVDFKEEIVDEASGETLELDVIEAKYFKFIRG